MREIDLHPDIAAYLAGYVGGREGLLFPTREGTPRLFGNVDDRQLKPALLAAGIAVTEGMGLHMFRRFRNTWLRGQKAQPNITMYWMGHKPLTMSELYWKLKQETQKRLDEAEQVGYGFELSEVAPNAPRIEDEILEEALV